MAAVASSPAALDEIAVLLKPFVELKDMGEISKYLSVSLTFDPSLNVFLLTHE